MESWARTTAFLTHLDHKMGHGVASPRTYGCWRSEAPNSDIDTTVWDLRTRRAAEVRSSTWAAGVRQLNFPSGWHKDHSSLDNPTVRDWHQSQYTEYLGSVGSLAASSEPVQKGTLDPQGATADFVGTYY